MRPRTPPPRPAPPPPGLMIPETTPAGRTAAIAYWIAIVLAALAAGAALAPPADAYSNGRFPASALARIHAAGGLQVYLNRAGAAASWNDLAGCAVREGRDLSPGGPQSAYRSIAGQNYFWGLYRSGRGNLAAYPGTSNHGWARAVDLASTAMRSFINIRGPPYGWRKIEAPSEWWHVNFVGGAPNPDPGPDPRFPILRTGSNGRCLGPAVAEVERRLAFIHPDSSYTAATAAAVQRFETFRRWRSPDGVVTYATWAQLRGTTTARRGESYLRLTTPPMRGTDVRVLQGQLNQRFGEIRYRTRVAVDGTFGPATAAAVRLFQRARKISPVTGIVGPLTVAALRTPAKTAAPTIPARPVLATATRPAPPAAPRITSTRISRHRAIRPARFHPTDIILHTTEGWDSSTGGLQAALAYFASNTREVSVHLAIDRFGAIGRSVPDTNVANHALGANATGLGIEQIGYAGYTRAQWLTRTRQLDATAAAIAYWSYRYKIPIRRCVAGGPIALIGGYKARPVQRHGVCAHGQITSGRTDPGPGYPWDYVLKRAQALAGSAG